MNVLPTHLADPRPPKSTRSETPALPTLTEAAHDSAEILQLAYPELRALARRFLLRERHGHTLQPTALVHEAFLRMSAQRGNAHNVPHFVALAARMMRRVLVNHALGKKAGKRGSGQADLALDDDESAMPSRASSVEVLALNEALDALEQLDARQAHVVELRYFGGLSIEETAEAMEVSVATVKRDWLTAKLWLRRRLRA